MKAGISLRPVNVNIVLKDKVYEALKEAITSMDLYTDEAPARLDERQLAQELGVSRTPVREAILRLEQDGLVQSRPRRGAFVVRKTKQEILEIICVWSALEGLGARLATVRSCDEEIGRLRKMFTNVDRSGEIHAQIDEYSEKNILFHQTIIGLSQCALLSQMAESLFIHIRSIRARTIRERDQAHRSIIDHMHIIEAIENRDSDLAERLVREHSQNLAEHVEKHVDYLE